MLMIYIVIPVVWANMTGTRHLPIFMFSAISHISHQQNSKQCKII